MVCEDCEKPCRNKTQQDLHTKHTGHTRYVDKASILDHYDLVLCEE